MRIDSHQHFWRFSPAEHGWLDDAKASLRRDFMPRELEAALKHNGFDGCVAVQAAQTLDESSYLLELAQAYPFVRGVVGWVDLRDPQLSRTLEELSAAERFKGVRHILQSEPPGFMADARFRAGVARLADFSLSYDVLVYAHQLPEVIELARAVPNVSCVLNHLAKPEVRAGRLEPWRQQLRRLAELPNVTCKLSGLVTEAAWDAWQPSQLAPFVDAAVESFGPERLLVGSDWPVCTLAGSYADVMRVFEDYFATFSADERAAIFGGNAERVYRLSA